MISSTRLTTNEFARRFPPGGKPNPRPPKSPPTKASKDGKKNDVTPMAIPNHAILNDVPGVATSCLVYNYDELQKHAGDSTYPVPPAEDFPNLRQLESRQAVFKRIKDDKCVFLHMLLSPDDGLEMFGQEFRDELLDIQRDVCPLFSVTDRRSPAMDGTKNLSRNTPM
jgi:hypothetical protein